MDYYSALLILSLLCVFLSFLKLYFSGCGNGKFSELPPGSKPLPVFGNIFQLTDKPHCALANLSKTYGPVMHLKLGSIHPLVVSSADMAREVFLKHDLAFSGRKVPDSARTLNHNLYSMPWLPISPQWRNLRRISSIQLFSMKCLDVSQSLRQKKVCELLDYVRECCRNDQAVDIGWVGFTTSLNLLSNTFFSVDLASYGSASSQEFKDVVCAIMEVVGKPSLADFFPILGYIDPLGIRRDAETYYCKIFAVFNDIIRQRLSADLPSLSTQDDVLATLHPFLLEEDGSDLSVDDIKHLLLDLFIAGTDTSSVTVEWAMTELLRNPAKMAKLKLKWMKSLRGLGWFRNQTL